MEEIKNMSNEDLRKYLIQYGEKVGPITHNLRGPYENLLKKLIKQHNPTSPETYSSNSEFIPKRKFKKIRKPLSSNYFNSPENSLVEPKSDFSKGSQKRSQHVTSQSQTKNIIKGDGKEIKEMTNDELRSYLIQHGEDVGPVFLYLRPIYEKRLNDVMKKRGLKSSPRTQDVYSSDSELMQKKPFRKLRKSFSAESLNSPEDSFKNMDSVLSHRSPTTQDMYSSDSELIQKKAFQKLRKSPSSDCLSSPKYLFKDTDPVVSYRSPTTQEKYSSNSELTQKTTFKKLRKSLAESLISPKGSFKNTDSVLSHRSPTTEDKYASDSELVHKKALRKLRKSSSAESLSSPKDSFKDTDSALSYSSQKGSEDLRKTLQTKNLTKSCNNKIKKMTDDELWWSLKQYGEDVGPVTPNLRALYEKRLDNLMKQRRLMFSTSPAEFNSSDSELMREQKGDKLRKYSFSNHLNRYLTEDSFEETESSVSFRNEKHPQNWSNSLYTEDKTKFYDELFVNQENETPVRKRGRHWLPIEKSEKRMKSLLRERNANIFYDASNERSMPRRNDISLQNRCSKSDSTKKDGLSKSWLFFKVLVSFLVPVLISIPILIIKNTY